METPGATEAGFKAAWPEMLKQIQIQETMKSLNDPLVGLRGEFDWRFAPSRNGCAPPSRSRPEPVAIESDY